MSNLPGLQLADADAQLTICPEIGGAIARYSWRDHPILRPASDAAIRERAVRQMGCYPLVPYSNRIGHAGLIVAGQRQLLRANSPPEPHALHGFGWQRAWHVTAHSGAAAELLLTNLPDADWPFACEALQKIALAGNALHLMLSVRNVDSRPMPAGLGFHPYFPAGRGTRLHTEWKGMWQMGADSLPTELVAVPPQADFSQSRPIDGWKVDHCFTGWSRRAALDYPAYRVQIEASDACRQVVCYAPNDGRDFIAIEPVTNVNNAFALAANGAANSGTQILAPGASLEISMSIVVSAH